MAEVDAGYLSTINRTLGRTNFNGVNLAEFQNGRRPLVIRTRWKVSFFSGQFAMQVNERGTGNAIKQNGQESRRRTESTSPQNGWR